MKIPNVNIFIILLILYTSCQTTEIDPDLGVATQYFHTASHLHDGIVNKYRIQYLNAKNKEIAENISYRSYQLNNNNQLSTKNYDVAGQLEVTNIYDFQEGAMLHKEQYIMNQGDTIVPTIHQATVREWKLDTSHYQKTVSYDWGKRISSFHQLSNKDTTILNKPAKLFEGKWKLTIVFEQDSTVYEFKDKEIFVAGLGLFYDESNSDHGERTMELVEQLSFQEFEKITSHNRRRVAYIDSTTVLDKGSSFKLCETQAKIVDYYNGQPNAGFDGGKGVLKRAILSKLDTTKLEGESGFLSFRFVINCEGEVGWFTTEQADLAYQKKQFNEETVQHFYEIISQLTTWHPTIIREEARDAYAYITIKLKDGAITDFLP